MKHYLIGLQAVVTITIEVDARNESEAAELAREKVFDDYPEHVNFNYSDFEVTDIEEEVL